MEDSVFFTEGGGECMEETYGSKTPAVGIWSGLGDGERAYEPGKHVNSLSAESAGAAGTTNGAGPDLFLPEALRNSHWGDEGGSANRGTPSNDWATFSPMGAPSTRHEVDPSHWVQETIAEGSGEDPTIPSTNDTSPGWEAFSLGTCTSSLTDETSESGGDTPDTADRSLNDTSSRHCRSNETELLDNSATTAHHCVTVLRSCFTVAAHTSDCHTQGVERGSIVAGEERPHLVAAECVGDWQCLRNDSFAKLLWRLSHTSLSHPPPSSCQHRLSSLLWERPSTNESEGVTAVALPLGDDEKFNWTPPHQRRRSLSPEVVPNLFRPRKESLVDVDFDHDRAASGLAVLSEVELQRMCDEMTLKFSRLSAELLTRLETRDTLAGEMEAKNRFVSALLRVQQLRLSQEVNGGASGEAGRGRQWVWGQKRRDEESSASMFLQTVIPYKIPEGLRWRTDTLTQLTKVLKAIAEGSNTVPKLMSEYLQSEFITSPITDRRHSFKDSLSPDHTSTLLSNISV